MILGRVPDFDDQPLLGRTRAGRGAILSFIVRRNRDFCFQEGSRWIFPDPGSQNLGLGGVPGGIVVAAQIDGLAGPDQVVKPLPALREKGQ